MDIQLLLSLGVFSVVTSITPGPNNLMLLASGTNFGFRRTLPHALGVIIGFFILLLGTGFGLGAVLVAFPSLHLALKIAGGVYLLYLAWRIAGSRVVGEADLSSNRPLTFPEAALFQLINPKAWFMATTAMAVYTDPERQFFSVIIVALVFIALNFPFVLTWAGCGMMLKRYFTGQAFLKWFNIVMALLLALCLWPLLN